jgi:hypothetical protein
LLVSRREQEAGVGEAIGRRLGGGDGGGRNLELRQITPVQRLFDQDRLDRRAAKPLHRPAIGGLRGGERQHPRVFAEIDRILQDVEAEAIGRQRAGGQFGVERQAVDRLAQGGSALPGFLGKSHHASPDQYRASFETAAPVLRSRRRRRLEGRLPQDDALS